MLNLKTATKEYKLLLIFILFIFALIMIPGVMPGLFVKEGYAWTSINTQNYMNTDLYYYVAGVKEIINGNILIKTHNNLLSCESARIVPYWLTSIPFWFFSFNVSIPLSIFLCIIAAMLIIYFICRNLDLDIYSSLLYSFVTIYFVQIWGDMPFVPFSRSSSISEGVYSLLQNIYYHLRCFIFMDMYQININFRYVNPCASNVLLFLNIFLTLRIIKNVSLLSAALCFISTLAMLFTYPSHTVISAVFMSSCFIYLCLEKDLKKVYIILSIGLGVLTFMFVFDYLSFIKSTYYQSYFLAEVHSVFKEGIVVKTISATLILSSILNKYAIMYLVFIYSFRDKIYGKLFLIFYFGLLLIVVATSFLDGDLIHSRFTIYGVDIPWFFGCVYACGTLVQKVIGYIPSHKLRKNLLIMMSSIFIILPTIGSVHFTYENLTKNSRFFPVKQAEIINWAADNLNKNDVIAALDFSDAHFLTYRGQYTNFISYVEIQKITVEDSFVHYIAVAKLCNMLRSEFNFLIKHSVGYIYYDLWIRSPPFVKDLKEFHNEQFTRMLAYGLGLKPWGINIAKRVIQGEKYALFKITEEFEKKLMEIFDGLDIKDYFSKNPVNYVLLSNEYYGHLATKLKMIYPVVFQNEYGLVFKVNKV